MSPLHYFFTNALEKNDWKSVKKQFEEVSNEEFNELFCELLKHKNAPKAFLKGAIDRLEDINAPVVPLNEIRTEGFRKRRRVTYSSWYNSPLCLAIYLRNRNALEMLLEKGAKVGLDEWMALSRLPSPKLYSWAKILAPHGLGREGPTKILLAETACLMDSAPLLNLALEQGCEIKDIVSNKRTYEIMGNEMNAFIKMLNQAHEKSPNFLNTLHDHGVDPLMGILNYGQGNYYTTCSGKFQSILKKSKFEWDFNWKGPHEKTIFERALSELKSEEIEIMLSRGGKAPLALPSETLDEYMKRLRINAKMEVKQLIYTAAHREELNQSAPSVRVRSPMRRI